MLNVRSAKILNETELNDFIIETTHKIEKQYSRFKDEEYNKFKELLVSIYSRGQKNAMPAGFAYVGGRFEADLYPNNELLGKFLNNELLDKHLEKLEGALLPTIFGWLPFNAEIAFFELIKREILEGTTPHVAAHKLSAQAPPILKSIEGLTAETILQLGVGYFGLNESLYECLHENKDWLAEFFNELPKTVDHDYDYSS